MKPPLIRISKRLSYLLRHRPDTVGLELAPGGWVSVAELLHALGESGQPLSLETLRQVVAENDKQRFEFSEDGQRIRARQGHSLEIDLGYAASIPPDVLYHGTATRHLASILEEGIRRAGRHHVHLSTNQQTMLQVGRRHGDPVLLAIDARAMHAAGHRFYVTGNQVWLTEHVPAAYLRVVS